MPTPASPTIANLSLPARDEHVAPRVAQRLELDVAAVQAVGVMPLAQPLLARLGAAQTEHARSLDARVVSSSTLVALLPDELPAEAGRRIDRGQGFEIPLGACRTKHATAETRISAPRAWRASL